MKQHKAYSRYANEAASLLGKLIRRRRVELKMTTAQLAERAGISRGLVQRIERGDLGCAIGSVFEAAAIVGVPLFDPSLPSLKARGKEVEQVLRLLPRSVRQSDKGVKDDF